MFKCFSRRSHTQEVVGFKLRRLFFIWIKASNISSCIKCKMDLLHSLKWHCKWVGLGHKIFFFFFFLNVSDSGVPLFHQSNSLLQSFQTLLLLLQRITCYNQFFSRSFCLLFVFLVRCFVDRGFCWRRLTISVSFRLTASSRSGFPY